MKTQVITPPASLPITFQQAFWHMRLPDFSDKDYVEMTIQDATDFAQSEMECSLVTQTLQVTHYEIPNGNRLLLPKGPVQSVVSVVANGTPFTNYSLQAVGNTDYILCTGIPQTPVVITYVAGYTTLPADLTRAILIQVGQFYENREATTDKQQYQAEMGLARIYCKYKRTSMVA